MKSLGELLQGEMASVTPRPISVPIPPYADTEHPYREFVAFLEQAYHKSEHWSSSYVTITALSAQFIGIGAGKYAYKGREISIEVTA